MWCRLRPGSGWFPGSLVDLSNELVQQACGGVAVEAELPIRQQWRSAAQSRVRLRCARRRDSSQRFGGVVAIQVDTARAVVDVGDRFGS
jgi:hypothetical protein